ncbi:LPS glycosyltransferase [Pyronema omphalodes]|nr:LPS glycosyltransferase [Pyronema omphalodes]
MLLCCFVYAAILLTTDSQKPLSSSSAFDTPRHRSHRGGYSAYKEPSGHQSVYNRTLGFGEVFYLSLPSRTDRQDAMELLAAYSNVTLTYVPGVYGNTIVEKAKPTKSKVTVAELGTWRAHANIWKKVMHSADYETALILEDDIDWDDNFAPILERLTKHLPKAGSSPPYGHEAWDVLWLGACLHTPKPAKGDQKAKVIRYDDPMAPNRSEMREYDRKYFDEHRELGGTYKDSGERVIQEAYQPVCTMAYAVTKRGAQQLLYHIGYRQLDGPVDLAMAWATSAGKIKGWVVWPPLITAWRLGGPKDSDIQKSSSQSKGNDDGHSDGIKKSARKEMAAHFMAPRN